MEEHFYQLFEQYGIYAVLALCTVEGDITLLLSGVMAHNGYFGPYSFFKVYLAGTARRNDRRQFRLLDRKIFR